MARAPFPDGFSAYGELEVDWDGVRLGAEVFDWGRVDADGRLAVQLAERRVEVAVNGLVLGRGQPGARHVNSAEVRWRFAGKLYALGAGGARLYPRADGMLRPVAFASLGLGVDHAR